MSIRVHLSRRSSREGGFVVKLRPDMIRRLIRSLGLKIAHTIGTPVRDFRSGKSLGRALMLPWRGKVHVIGLKEPLRPMFQPQKRLTYWKQEIVFTEHPPPDFPRERGNPKAQAPNPKEIPNPRLQIPSKG